MKTPPNPEIVARLREMIMRFALEEADALVTYYRHAKDPNADTILKNASRASAITDVVVAAHACHATGRLDAVTYLRGAAATARYGVAMSRRLQELAVEIESVGRGLPSAVPDDAEDHEDTAIDAFIADDPTDESGTVGSEQPLFV